MPYNLPSCSSLVSDFHNDTHAHTMIIAKGGAAVSETDCKFCKPPVISNTIARAAMSTPHTPILDFEGLRSPLFEYIDRTNVAEFAQVTKNVVINTSIVTDMMKPRG